MAYNNSDNNISFIKRLYYKFFLSLSRFPYNGVRCWALRMCGFQIGKDVYIGGDLVIALILGDKRCKLSIGDRSVVSSRANLLLASEPNKSRLSKIYKPIMGEITICDDCWIGINVTVFPNVTIGKCSVIGSGTLVTKDVPPYSVVVGVPGKIVKKIKEEDLCEL